jgi:prephenate dehydrogenase
MNLEQARVTVIGLGLMGGSLAKALKGCCRELIGVDLDPLSLEQAVRSGAVDLGVKDAAEGLSACDLAILAVPVCEIIRILDRIGDDLPAPAFLMDLGSTKVNITNRMESLPGRVDPIGGHPFCGKETAGFHASESDLFQGAPFILTPLPRSSTACLRLAHQLIARIGARAIEVEAERHDRIVAVTSHLPYLLAASLTALCRDLEQEDPFYRELIAGGLIDTTRVAASDLRMITDVLLTNGSNVADALGCVLDHLNTLGDLTRSNQGAALLELLEPIQKWRSDLTAPVEEGAK